MRHAPCAVRPKEGSQLSAFSRNGGVGPAVDSPRLPACSRLRAAFGRTQLHTAVELWYKGGARTWWVFRRVSVAARGAGSREAPRRGMVHPIRAGGCDAMGPASHVAKGGVGHFVRTTRTLRPFPFLRDHTGPRKEVSEPIPPAFREQSSRARPG